MVDQLAFGYTHYDGVKNKGVHFDHAYFRKPYRHVDPENAEPEHVKIQDFRHIWIRNKLFDPRVFDGGKLSSLPPDELLKMPNFYLNPEEVRLLTTFILSFTNHDVPLNLVERAKKRLNEDEIAINRGHRLIRENNCRACHRFSLDKLEMEWVREEQVGSTKKTVRSFEWVEGMQTGLISEEKAAPLLARWNIKTLPGVPVRLYTFSWVSDGCTMDVSGVVNRDARFVLVEGSKAEYLDIRNVGGEDVVTRRPIRRWKPVDGGEILPHIDKYKKAHADDWQDEDGNSLVNLDDPSTLPSRYPPLLRSQGVKTQQQWLFDFLKRPEDHLIRPALHAIVEGGKGPPDPNIRMPNFGFSDEEAAALVRYFWARDRLASEETHPFTTFHEREGNYFSARRDAIEKAGPMLRRVCGECHYFNGAAPAGGPEYSYKFAPELANAQDRLRPRWLYPWLRQPSLVYPGTPMTSADYKEIGGGDQEKGIQTAVEFLMNWRRIRMPAEEKKPENKPAEKKPPDPNEKK